MKTRQKALKFVYGLVMVALTPAWAQVSENVLHTFHWDELRSVNPGGVTLAPDGIYGTTQMGGAHNISGDYGAGMVYKLDYAGNFKQLYLFGNYDGDAESPNSGLVLDPAGNVYGTTQFGGAFGYGTIFEISPSGSETILYNFTGGSDGANPLAGVFRSPAGDLYGTTVFGGCCQDGGVIFRLDPTGNYHLLHVFHRTADGGQPYSGVILDAAGNLYGTAGGGAVPAGVIYRLSASGGYQVLYNFTAGADGYGPGPLTRDAAGNLYGTASLAPQNSAGVVYKLDPAGNYTVLHTFTEGFNGTSPYGVVLDSAGNLYGASFAGGLAACSGGCGTVYRIDTAGNFEVLYSFPGGAVGSWPGPVTLNSAGNLIGTTEYGGSPHFRTTYYPGTLYILKSVNGVF